jgi:hypothetical protein
MKKPIYKTKMRSGIQEYVFRNSVSSKKTRLPKVNKLTETPTDDTMSIDFGLKTFTTGIAVAAKATMTTPMTMLLMSPAMTVLPSMLLMSFFLRH